MVGFVRLPSVYATLASKSSCYPFVGSRFFEDPLFSFELMDTVVSFMKAGAAVEALAKGAMRFSHRFTVRELRERWRALLYDPELSAEASARMVEAEAALSDLPPKAGGSQARHVKHLEQKRRSNSIRSLYHKRKRSLTDGKPISATESQTPDEGAIREAGEKNEEGKENLVVAPLSTMPLGNVDPGLLEGLLSPKGGATDFDNTFTQMVSLLAAGQSVHASRYSECDHLVIRMKLLFNKL